MITAMMKKALGGSSIRCSGVNAPPGGLYLVHVGYDTPFRLPVEYRPPVYG